MIDLKNMSFLEAIEALAYWEDMIDSEEALSEKFDEDMGEFIEPLYEEDDEVAINEEFSNWTDNLCKEGVLHKEQDERYKYVGKYQC